MFKTTIDEKTIKKLNFVLDLSKNNMYYCSQSLNNSTWGVHKRLDRKYLLVEADVLPGIFLKVLEAKKLLTDGHAKNTSEAVRMVGISRGAYYKYKDSVFPYNNIEDNSIITVNAVLNDVPGVLMAFVSAFYDMGANILTINQNIPVDSLALISISARTDSMMHTVNELLDVLGKIRGVRSVNNVSTH